MRLSSRLNSACSGHRVDLDQRGFGSDKDISAHLRHVRSNRGFALRDIKAKRTKLTPVSPSDLKTLIEMGLAEMCDDAPMLTNAGHQAIDQ
jgi:hypothetical protein